MKNNNIEPPIIEEFKCICLSAMVVNDFCFQIGWKLLSRRMKSSYYLEEWKYNINEKKTKSFIRDDLESSSDNDSGVEENSEKSIVRF